MTEYWMGVVTPFACIGGLALLLGTGYLLYRLAEWLNERTHTRFMEKIKIARNLADPFGQKPERPKFFDKATHLRDALLRSPKMWMVRTLGFCVLIVRDFETEEQSDDTSSANDHSDDAEASEHPSHTSR